MPEANEPSGEKLQAAEAVVEAKRGFSIIWIIPITAALVGAWLVYKAEMEKGPTVSITFSSAQGVEAGKTKVKFKDVDVGQVTSVSLSKDLEKVTFQASLDRTLDGHLSENSSFWIVAPRLAGGTVSGLGTLLSGVYIGMDPGPKGSPKHDFVGLSEPPLVSAGTPGRHFNLITASLGSLGLGSPVYFRQLQAGQVESFKLDEDGKAVHLRIFINEPYDKYVHAGTRFWNASGISASLSAEGIKVSTESLIALLTGGIAFDLPKSNDSREPPKEDQVFELYDSEEEADTPEYGPKRYLLMYFDGSVRGLSVGAPVEIRGITMGKVTDIYLEADARDFSLRIPVTVEYELGRIKILHEQDKISTFQERKEKLQRLVDKGLRAQLKTGSLLTGQLFVELDFHPDAAPEQISVENGIIVFPTVPSALDEIRTSLTDLMNKLHKIPLEEIGNELRNTVRGASELTNSEDLRQSLKHLNRTLANSQQLTAQLNENTAPALAETLNEAIATLTSLQQNVLEEDSALYYELTRTLMELSNAARSVRSFADYLEQHPNALITGK
jgi:paraquat-inducible protein B